VTLCHYIYAKTKNKRDLVAMVALERMMLPEDHVRELPAVMREFPILTGVDLSTLIQWYIKTFAFHCMYILPQIKKKEL
jgi:hypothetical protein